MYISEMMKSFHALPACDRIDLICRILRHCTNYEVKFVGQVMSDVSSSQVKENPSLEGNANRANYYALFDKETGLTHAVCEKLCHALALLHPDNRSVAEVVFNLLDDSRVLNSFRETTDISVLDDYRLLYVMATNHPVLSFGQRYHLMYTYLQAMDVLYSAKVKLDCEVTSSSLMKVEKTDSISGKTVPYPEALPDACVTRLDVHGVYKRLTDKRFIYIIQVEWSDSTTYAIRRTYGDFFTFQNKLLDLFPEESGQKNKKHRIIPYLPGKKIITNKSNRELAEKRLPELAKYAKELVMLPSYIICSAHVQEFFKPRDCDCTEAFPPLHEITNLQDCQQESGKVRQPSESPSIWSSPGQDTPPRPDIGLERSSKTLPFAATAASGGNDNPKPADSPLERRFTYPARQVKANGLAPPTENTPLHPEGKSVSLRNTPQMPRSPSSRLLLDEQHPDVCSTTNTPPTHPPSQPLSPARTLTPMQEFLSTSNDHISSGSCLMLPLSTSSSTSMPDLDLDRTGPPKTSGYSQSSTPSLATPDPNALHAPARPNIGSSNYLPATSPPLPAAHHSTTSLTSTSSPRLPAGMVVGSLSLPYMSVPPSQPPHPSSAGPTQTTIAPPTPSYVTSHLPVIAMSSSVSMATLLPVPVTTSSSRHVATPSLVSTAMPLSVSRVVSGLPDTPPVLQPGGATSPQDNNRNELNGQGLQLPHMGSSSSIPNISSFGYGSPLPSPVTSSPHTPYIMGSTGSVAAQDSDSLPKWLKRHRLHKYANIFNGMTFEEMQLLTEENLKEKGMTAGAAKKLRLKLDELGRFNFCGFQQESMKSSTCSLPTSLLLAERGMTLSSSSERLTPYGSSTSLDQANETSSLVPLSSNGAPKSSHAHHHTHRRAESLGVIPTLTDAAIVKVVQGGPLQESSEGAAASEPTTASTVNPETLHSSQDSGISRTSVSAESSTSWADQGTGEGEVCLPTWAQLRGSTPNMTTSTQNSLPILSHTSTPPPTQHHHHHHHQSHSSKPYTPPSLHITTHASSVGGGRNHAPLHKLHSSDSVPSEAVHHVGFQFMHQMVPPPQAHAPYNGNSWQAVRPIIIPGAMQLPRGAPRGGQVPILANGIMACTAPMQHMGRVPMFFTGCMVPHPPLVHGRTTQNMTCFNCGKKGHLGNSCPNGNINSASSQGERL